MTSHKVGTREEWLGARTELLANEKALTRQGDEVARQRRELPWVRLDKDYAFDTDEGSASLADLFRGRSQLLVYHFMFGPDYTAGCLSCSAIADGFNGFAVHLANHDVMLWAVSRAPLDKLQAYKQRMGWSFPWASSNDRDFNFDFNVSLTEEQQRSGSDYNFREQPPQPPAEAPTDGPLAAWAATTGTDWPTYARERPGMSAFALEDGIVYHTYSTYARGLDALWGMYQWLDRAPLRAKRDARRGRPPQLLPSARRVRRRLTAPGAGQHFSGAKWSPVAGQAVERWAGSGWTTESASGRPSIGLRAPAGPSVVVVSPWGRRDHVGGAAAARPVVSSHLHGTYALCSHPR